MAIYLSNPTDLFDQFLGVDLIHEGARCERSEGALKPVRLPKVVLAHESGILTGSPLPRPCELAYHGGQLVKRKSDGLRRTVVSKPNAPILEIRIEIPVYVQREIEVNLERGKAAARAKFQPYMFCEHANEGSHGRCQCPTDCACRERMCRL